MGSGICVYILNVCRRISYVYTWLSMRLLRILMEMVQSVLYALFIGMPVCAETWQLGRRLYSWSVLWVYRIYVEGGMGNDENTYFVLEYIYLCKLACVSVAKGVCV